MNIQVKYFGMLVEVTTYSEEVWSLNQATSVAQFKLDLLEKYPLLLEKKFKIAINKKIVNDASLIKSGDELALLPPFAGG